MNSRLYYETKQSYYAWTVPEDWPSSLICPSKLRLYSLYVLSTAVIILKIFFNIARKYFDLEVWSSKFSKLLIQWVVMTAFVIKKEMTVLPMIRFGSSNRILLYRSTWSTVVFNPIWMCCSLWWPYLTQLILKWPPLSKNCGTDFWNGLIIYFQWK